MLCNGSWHCKHHYRKDLLRKRILAFDNRIEFVITLFDALKILRRSWELVTPETIANCFRKAAFTISEEAVAEIEPIDDKLAEMWNGLQEKEGELTDYIEADDYLTTAAVPTIEQIADEFLAVDDVMEEDEESEEIAEERPRVSENEAYKAMQIVQDYIQSNSANPAILKHADELDEYISKKWEKRKQSKISDYFKKL
ncbi:tigger transposable element-derived protein 4-like [Ditylenchus destructor]|uniref:Tigger transposable element-derived protein 4-like n=1 Tax=Ditylenchus destructor TaxID=166010 RepID=A0AAD4QT55_9BILA|nr:tigger transposable element-derived protein 4-like [Ditylenchus destructor]